jgi:hypothetical protein
MGSRAQLCFALIVLAGCARSAPVASAVTTQAATMRGRTVNAPDGRRHVLLDSRIADRCPAVERAPDDAPPTVLLGALASCLNGRELGDRYLVVSGGAKERIFIRRALADFGVDSDRVECSGPLDEDDCVDTCDDKKHVTIELATH